MISFIFVLIGIGFGFLGLLTSQDSGSMGAGLIASGCVVLFIIFFGLSMLAIFGIRIIDWL